MGLDRVAVEIGIEDRRGMHRDRPLFATSSAIAESLFQLCLNADATSFEQAPAARSSDFASLVGTRIAALVVERIFRRVPSPFRPGEAIDVGEALQQAAIEVGGEKVAKAIRG